MIVDQIENATFHTVGKESQGPVYLGVILGRGNVMSENDHGACCSLLPSQCATLNRCPLASGPSAGLAGRCVPPSSLTLAQLLQVAFWGSPCLAVRQRAVRVCVGPCGRVCLFRAPSGREQQVSEECDYRTQWEKAGLWQVWLKMEELAQMHAGKLSAVVTCAIVSTTFASITLKVKHRHRQEP